MSSLFFLVSLSSCLSILLIFFSKKQLFVLLIFFPYWFSIKSLFSLFLSISFIFTPSFIIPFVLLVLVLFCSFCLGSWGRSLDYRFDSFTSFLMYVFSTINFPFSTALAVCPNFWYILFSFSFSSGYFLNFSWDFLFCWWVI